MEIVENEDYNLVSIEKFTYDKLESIVPKIDNNHILLQLSDDINDIENKINFFLETASTLKAKNKSFVLIKRGIKIENFPENLNIAPTLQEAKDILEMENIERDLGF